MTAPGARGDGAIGSTSTRVWSVDPVRIVLPASQWAALVRGRPGLHVPPAFAVQAPASGMVDAPAGDQPQPDPRGALALARMLDVVDAAPIRVHVGSWGRGRVASAVVCVGGDRAVTLATTGRDLHAGARRDAGGARAATAPEWIEVSALWGGDVLAEVMRAGHPDLDGGPVGPNPLKDHGLRTDFGPRSATVDALASLAWAAAMRDGDAGALQALLSRAGAEDVPEQIRAAVDGLVGATTVQVEVRGGAGDMRAVWLGVWLATSEGTLALRLEGAVPQRGEPGQGGERVRMWWATPGEVSRDVVVALAGAYDAALGPATLTGPAWGDGPR